MVEQVKLHKDFVDNRLEWGHERHNFFPLECKFCKVPAGGITKEEHERIPQKYIEIVYNHINGKAHRYNRTLELLAEGQDG